jgi:FdhD protein
MNRKCSGAGIPIVAAISAPSSLAADYAQDLGQTLVGFLRREKMNNYAGADHVRCCAPSGNSNLG